MGNKHFRERTEEQVQRKADRLRTEFMAKRIMVEEPTSDLLHRMLSKFPWRRKHLKRLVEPRKKEIRKIKRLDRKARRIHDGKWRKGRTGSQTT